MTHSKAYCAKKPTQTFSASNLSPNLIHSPILNHGIPEFHAHTVFLMQV